MARIQAMSMRGPGGEENSAEGPSKVDLSVGREVVCSSGHSTSPTTAATACPLSLKCKVSPLLSIFSSKEIVPRVLEYEKAILVMKEHDYAKRPERAEVLQLSSLLEGLPFAPEEQKESTKLSDPVSLLLNSSKDIQDFRESLCRKEDGLVTNQLRELVSMHVELIREQQEQLHDKDKLLSTVRKDKEQVRVMHAAAKEWDFPRLRMTFDLVVFVFVFLLESMNAIPIFYVVLGHPRELVGREQGK